MIQKRLVVFGVSLLVAVAGLSGTLSGQQNPAELSGETLKQNEGKREQFKKTGAETGSAKSPADKKASPSSTAQDADDNVDVKPQEAADGVKLIVVVGADGEEVYGKQFGVWAERWRTVADENKIDFTLIRGQPAEKKTDYQRVKEAIEATGKREALWLVLIGHGTDDRKQSKFNLIGPDLTAKELNGWLESVECPVAVINCASCSGAFIAKLKAKNRVVVSSTRSGAQYNFSRFGGYLSQAISDPTLDLDKDQQTSLLEAFIAASKQTQDFYVEEKRLASELALIDDNGDGLGTPGDWFAGTRVVKRSTDKTVQPDGRFASRLVLVPSELEASLTKEQRDRRDRLEDELEQLRNKKADLDESTYFAKLEAIMLQLAKIYAD